MYGFMLEFSLGLHIYEDCKPTFIHYNFIKRFTEKNIVRATTFRDHA